MAQLTEHLLHRPIGTGLILFVRAEFSSLLRPVCFIVVLFSFDGHASVSFMTSMPRLLFEQMDLDLLTELVIGPTWVVRLVNYQSNLRWLKARKQRL